MDICKIIGRNSKFFEEVLPSLSKYKREIRGTLKNIQYFAKLTISDLSQIILSANTVVPLS